MGARALNIQGYRIFIVTKLFIYNKNIKQFTQQIILFEFLFGMIEMVRIYKDRYGTEL